MTGAPAIPEIRDQEAFNLERWAELCGQFHNNPKSIKSVLGF